MNTPITASIPNAVIGNLVPTTLAIFAVLRPAHFGDATFYLTALACGMQIYFLVLANKLYQTTLNSLLFQAEKDQLITELEQARINSDLARRRSEEANLAKSRFLATMSHELRTPLNAILGFSEVMKGELFGTHNVPAYKEYSNDIHSSGEHLLMLINEILDLSRVEAGRYELREESISLANIVEDCRHLLTLRAKKRNITVTEAFEPQLPRMWADERAVRQVALNLLSNAIKFTPQGGAITIKVGWTAAGGQYFSVRDTGPGIPEDEIPVVMSSFGRGSLAQKKRRGRIGPRPAHRQRSRRTAWRHLHPEIQGPRRHGSHRRISARADHERLAAARSDQTRAAASATVTSGTKARARRAHRGLKPAPHRHSLRSPIPDPTASRNSQFGPI